MWQFGPPNRQWRRWFRGRRRHRGCCHKQGTDEAQKRENGQDGSQEANHGQTIPEDGLDIADAFPEERSSWTRGFTRSCRGWCCRSTSACFAALSTYRWRSCWGMGSRPARGSPRRDRSDCWAPLDGGGHSGVALSHPTRRAKFAFHDPICAETTRDRSLRCVQASPFNRVCSTEMVRHTQHTLDF